MKEFHQWLITVEKLKKDTADNYTTWLKQNIINDIKTFAPSVCLTKSEEKFQVVIPALLKAGIEYKAELVCNLLLKHINEAITLTKGNTNLNNDRASLKKYIKYIKTKKGGINVTTLPVPDYDALMPYRKELSHYPTRVAKSKFDKINGTDSLVELFGNNHKAFIEKVLSESYFIDPGLESDRFGELSGELLVVAHARYSEDYKNQYPDMSKRDIIKKTKKRPATYPGTTIKVELDDDGNRFLRDYINETTNYWISKGKKDSQFIGFKISHIWGQATDPRYFSSLWNVVIVPAWANDLLDKDSSASSLIAKMIGTFKGICIDLYGMKARTWGQIGLSSMPDLEPTDRVEPGTYQINVIKRKLPSQVYGEIYTKDITL